MRGVNLLTAALALVGVARLAEAGLIADRATLDALLGAGAINEDFESYVVAPGTSETLEIGFLDSTTITNGQGPGLVEPGATYISGAGGVDDKFAWQGDGYVGLSTKTLVAFVGPGVPTTLTIEYDQPVVAMGLDLFDYAGFSHTTMISVFDPGGALLDSFDLFIGGPTGVFFGYEAGAIGSVQLTGNPQGWSTVIDDHTYGIPAPATIVVLTLGCLAGRRRR